MKVLVCCAVWYVFCVLSVFPSQESRQSLKKSEYLCLVRGDRQTQTGDAEEKFFVC